jgi:hypothetical protein
MPMRTRIVLIGFAVFALGLVATLLSGFYGRNISQYVGVSKFGCGFPLSWHGHSQVVYPGAPVVYWFNCEAFMLDITFWSLIFSLLAAVSYMIMNLKS